MAFDFLLFPFFFFVFVFGKADLALDGAGCDTAGGGGSWGPLIGGALGGRLAG